MLFAIEDLESGAKIFYGTDSGGLTPGVWKQLADEGWLFDILILDHSYGHDRRSHFHHGLDSFLKEVVAARAAGAINDQSRVLATHLSHFSYPSYAAMIQAAENNQFELARDGQVLMIESRVAHGAV